MGTVQVLALETADLVVFSTLNLQALGTDQILALRSYGLSYGAIAKNIVSRSKVQSRHAIVDAPSERDQPAERSDCSETTPQSQAPQIDMDEILLEMQQLQTALYEAETRCAQVEQKVREDVLNELQSQFQAWVMDRSVAAGIYPDLDEARAVGGRRGGVA